MEPLSAAAAAAAELGQSRTAVDTVQLHLLHWTFGRDLPQSWTGDGSY